MRHDGKLHGSLVVRLAVDKRGRVSRVDMRSVHFAGTAQKTRRARGATLRCLKQTIKAWRFARGPLLEVNLPWVLGREAKRRGFLRRWRGGKRPRPRD